MINKNHKNIFILTVVFSYYIIIIILKIIITISVTILNHMDYQ